MVATLDQLDIPARIHDGCKKRWGGASATFVDGNHVDVMQRGGDHSCHPRVGRLGGDDESRRRRKGERGRMGGDGGEMEGMRASGE